MPPPVRGTKRHCSHCGANFYDLNRSPAVCPKCQMEYVPSARIPLRLPMARPAWPRRDEPAVHRGPEDAERFAEDEVLHEEEEEGEESLAEEDGEDTGNDVDVRE